MIDLAAKVAGWADDGESVEVYVSRGTDTEVRVYEGEVESLVVSHVRRRRHKGRLRRATGFRLRRYPHAKKSWPRRSKKHAATPSFRALNPGSAWPAPDGAAPVPLDLWRDELATWPTQRKVDAALDLERAVRDRDKRIRQVEWARWADSSKEMAIATSLGVLASDRSTACYLSAMAVAGDGAESKVAHGYTVGRSPSDLVPAKAADDAVSGRCGCSGPRNPARVASR